MRLTRLLIFSVLLSIFFIGCKSDDDNGPEQIPPRDQGEQAIADDEAIMTYLQTHFYNKEDFENPSENFDYKIKFDTISEENSDRTPLIESDLLFTEIVTRNEVDYTIYILKIREGVGAHPTFADSTFQNYKGELLNRTVFDNTVNPVWFDHPGTMTQNNQGEVPGLTQALIQFGEASSFTVNADNTVSWSDDFGIGAVFVPSGLAYFANGTATIPAYSPLIFSFQLYRVNEADHDRDGIPSYMEDLDGNGILSNDDSDGNSFPDYLDADDDGDGTLTRDEIVINEDGSIEFTDTSGNGIPDYLDPDTF